MAILDNTFHEERMPNDIEEYKKWFSSKFNYNPARYSNFYKMVTSKLKRDFVNSDFFKKLEYNLSDINDKYNLEKGYTLLSNLKAPEIYTKSLESLIIKTYRKNILLNHNFPNPPETDWINQNNWFYKINDILRTTIVVKYLDGVEFILNEISKIAQESECSFDYSLEAKEEGYYAAHGGLRINMELCNMECDSFLHDINVEIQVTTELQDIIKNLLHKYYEYKRQKTENKGYKWQWDYKCDEFATNYLGHIVHYVEGMIVEIRDKQNEHNSE